MAFYVSASGIGYSRSAHQKLVFTAAERERHDAGTQQWNGVHDKSRLDSLLGDVRPHGCQRYLLHGHHTIEATKTPQAWL